MVAIILLLFLFEVMSYDNSSYTLGNNLVSNPQFALPDIGSSAHQTVASASGWTCIPKTEIVNLTTTCANWGRPCQTNYTKAIDLDSNSNFDQLLQNVTITENGTYLLTVIWLAAITNPIGKKFKVTVNNVQLQNITCNASNSDYTFQKVQIMVDLVVGQTELLFQMYGTPDFSGLFISAVYLQKMTAIFYPTSDNPQNQAVQTIQSVIANKITITTNGVAGNRIFLRAFTDHMITFDRLRMYYFHRQNLTQFSTVLLSNINSLALDQGAFCQDLVNECTLSVCTFYTNCYENALLSIDLKKNYTDSFMYERNPNGLGFFANNLDFFFYELPFIFLTYLLFSLLFRLLFNFRVSKYFRKYAFYGLFLLILYEGNVEQFAFFFFSECRNLFSANLSHKLANIFLIYFFFLTIAFSVGGLFFYFYNYRKLVKYFLEDSERYNIQAVVIQSLQRSVYPLIFGGIHALFLDSLGIQTILLGIVEAAYFCAKVYALRSITPLSKIKIVFLLVSSLLRMGFIASFYLYEQNNYPQIINLVHYQMVVLYIICWIVQFFIDVSALFVEIYQTIKKLLCKRSNQQQPSPDKKVEKRLKQEDVFHINKEKQALKERNKKVKMNCETSKNTKKKVKLQSLEVMNIQKANRLIAKDIIFKISRQQKEDGLKIMAAKYSQLTNQQMP